MPTIDLATLDLRKLDNTSKGRVHDLDMVVLGEGQEYGSHWGVDDIEKFLLRPRAHLEIAEASGRVGARQRRYIVGHVLYILNACNIQLVSLAVHPDCRGKRIGGWLLANMTAMLQGTKTSLYGDLDAYNVVAQKWLRGQGVRAVKTVWAGKQEFIRFKVDVTEVQFACLPQSN